MTKIVKRNFSYPFFDDVFDDFFTTTPSRRTVSSLKTDILEVENGYELHIDLKALYPGVVGHFDLIRIFDPGYVERLSRPAVWERIERNLCFIAGYGGVLDLNVRALLKGATEPYVSGKILRRALDLGISVCPGDDSHGVGSVGGHIGDGIALLDSLEAPGWCLPG